MISFAVVMGVALAVLAGLAWLALLSLRQWRGVRRLRRQGLHRQARIEAVRVLGHGHLRLTLAFAGHDGLPQLQTQDVHDRRPHLRRFEVGRSVAMRVSPDPSARPSWLLAEGRIGFGALAWLAPVLLVVALLAGQGLFRLRWYQAGGEYSEMFSRGQPEFVVALVWIIPVLLALAAMATRWLKRRH